MQSLHCVSIRLIWQLYPWISCVASTADSPPYNSAICTWDRSQGPGHCWGGLTPLARGKACEFPWVLMACAADIRRAAWHCALTTGATNIIQAGLSQLAEDARTKQLTREAADWQKTRQLTDRPKTWERKANGPKTREQSDLLWSNERWSRTWNRRLGRRRESLTGGPATRPHRLGGVAVQNPALDRPRHHDSSITVPTCRRLGPWRRIGLALDLTKKTENADSNDRGETGNRADNMKSHSALDCRKAARV